jgi:hypothetical protein|eukprot:CAMPEP_0202505300 /NCGR_PEP_ID=MMETSP1361-20130828/46913_1 /ASSEMBLY_ACC=CAM_ASM_000849 /TAXON_ID=210615 /ORGANISM="Staurosira complex sp., Strain CCMP2646" /LENGTH=75 /DNA_ID=CAMNT_0049139007 /DNA_START=63 /DNA_END=290 /DNA_ORIENTATION=-
MTHPVPTIPLPKNQHNDGDAKTDEEHKAEDHTKQRLPTKANEIHHGNEQASKYPGGHNTFCAFMNDHETYDADEP